MKIIVDKLATEYRDEGKGKTILLLHGWMDSLQTFDSIVKELVTDYRVVRLDMPGFGGTEAPEATWGISDYVAFVRDFLIKTKLEPEAILGHSFGGRVAIKGIATGELETKKLILVASAGIAKGKSLRNIVITVAAKVFGLLTYIPPFVFYRDSLKRRLYKAIGSDYLDTGVLRDTFLKTIREDLQEAASQIQLPALLIWGENDTSTPKEDGEKLAKLITKSRLVVIPGATHFVHQEKATEVAEAIKEFLC